MGQEGGDSDHGTSWDPPSEAGSSAGGNTPPLEDLVSHPLSPLFHAEHAARYERQRLISAYQERFDCRLIVVSDQILPESVTYLEELIHDADPDQDLHLVLNSPGGDGETAVRLARSIQARCAEFTVIVPDQAKSAATILALGAHRIIMGPTSDLGPVDPQLAVPRQNGGVQWVAAKDLIAALESAERAVEDHPHTFPLHASLMADVTEMMVQQARAAIDRTHDLVVEAIKSNPNRDDAAADKLAESLKQSLIARPHHHGAIVGAEEAGAAGLPVENADPSGLQWRAVWQLWSKYFLLPASVYEGRRASRVLPWPQV